MNGTELLHWLDGGSSGALFARLYGGNEAEAGKKRYRSLVEAMLREDAFPRRDFPECDGELRLFTAAGRTELGGNHTDHNRGKVLAASIQLDIAAAAAPRNDSRVFFRSTGYPDVIVELAGADGKPDLAPKAEEKNTTEALVRGIAAEFAARGAPVRGCTINADSTVLPGSGLSSSAAVEVLFGRIYDNLFAGGGKSAVEIAQIGQKAENLYFGKPCGLMDQTACASGGAVAIDFKDAEQPLVRQVDVDLEGAGFVLCVVNTRGSHAGLTPDYAAIPAEMKAIAAYFGKDVLRETDENEVLARAGELRNTAGDRALLRAMHFFNENRRVDAMLDALERLGTAYSPGARDAALASYLALINESGDSSWELLQNVYTPRRSGEQGVSLALALTRNFLGGGAGACRVHGGGFAGTIQSCIPLDALERYRERMDGVFGAGSVTPLRIRPIGAEELRL